MNKLRLFVFIPLWVFSVQLSAQTDTTLMLPTGTSIHAVYHIAESEKPMVVLQAGARSHSAAWSALIPMLTKAGYSYLAYDRPGLGESGATDGDRGGEQISNELRNILIQLQLDKELILVGHSMGGVYQAIYNDAFPKKIKGLVMIDSPDISWEEGLRGCLTTEQNAARDSSLQVMRAALPELVRGEYEGAEVSFELLTKIKVANKLVVISGGAQNWPDNYDADCLNTAWAEVQKRQLNLNEQAVQLISESSGHGIPYQDPQLILDAINLMK